MRTSGTAKSPSDLPSLTAWTVVLDGRPLLGEALANVAIPSKGSLVFQQTRNSARYIKVM